MNHISFRESDHSYTSRSGERYISVTTLLSLYKQKFDAGYWSYYKALEQYLCDNYGKAAWWEFKRNTLKQGDKTESSIRELVCRLLPKDCLYIDTIQQQVLKQWDKTRDDACEKGTAYHLKREQDAYERGYEEHPHLDEVLPGIPIATEMQQVYTFNLSDLPDGYYAELLVYNHKHRLAGQIDKCWITTDQVTGKRYVLIDDFKTNRKIKTENKYQKMSSPLSSLDDCSLNHYILQICTYGWMLEQHGFTVLSTRFTHIEEVTDFLDEVTVREVPYDFSYAFYKPLVEAMIADYSLNHP